MISRCLFLEENLTPAKIVKIENILGSDWDLKEGYEWTERYYIPICTYTIDDEPDLVTEQDANMFEDQLIFMLKPINLEYEISQY